MIVSCDLEGLDEVVDILLQKCQRKIKQIVLLRGDLASGKTTLIKSFAQRVGVLQDVSSPTFSFQHIYEFDGGRILHYDCYRKELQEALALGILEMLDANGWHFVEWGDEKLEKILKQNGFEVMVLEITKQKDKRLYRIC